MITETGNALIKLSGKIDNALSFITERIHKPLPPQELFIPPTRKKKVDDNGNILKPLIGHKNKGEIFGKYNPKFMGPARSIAGIF